MTMEISKTEKALRLIATEGISAKEAAERVGISGAAVSKGKLWPSKSTQNIRKLCEMENEIESLRSEIAALKAENEWQPIETAPKDEAVFLAWRKHATHPLMVRYEPSYDWFANYDGEHVYDLTHWMPLPKPPAMAQGEQE